MSGEQLEHGDWVRAEVHSLPTREGVFLGVGGTGLYRVQPWSKTLGRLAHSVLYYHPNFVSRAPSPIERLDRWAADAT